jgi:adenine phosphoribosyltransferase
VKLRMAAIGATLLFACVAQAETLVENVNGISVDERGQVARFKGLLIGDDGRIIKLYNGLVPAPQPLPRKKKKDPIVYPPQPAFRLDGKGQTLLPGMIDSHGHVMGLGFQQLNLDLSNTKTLADALAKIAAHARDNPSRKWIIGRGWNQEVWGLGRFPTAADLDAVVSDVPVWLERVDGHAGWANSAAMAVAGVSAKTVAPAGGRVETLGGKPSGIFVDAAQALIERFVPLPLSKERDLAFVKAQTALLSRGVTSVADMGTSVEDWNTYRRAGDRGALRMRIFSYARGIEPMLAIAGGEPTPWLYDARLRMAGVKLVMDGALGSRGAWLKSPYADKPGERGLQLLSDAQLRNLMTRASMDGFQLAVHAIGDAANSAVLGAIEELSDTFTGDRRWRIEHAQVIASDDLPRFARHGIIASMQPVHRKSDRLMAEARLGADRMSGAYAWNALLGVGGKLAFGTDTPVEAPDPFANMAFAISPDDASVQQNVTPQQALAAYTSAGATAAFAEAQTGRIAPGLYADFILVDRDPLAATPEQLRNMLVNETWVGGQRVYSRRGTSVPAAPRRERMSDNADLMALIRTIPDYPKPGIMFRDITTLIADPTGFSLSVMRMAALVAPFSPNLIAGIEARGFIFGAALAHAMGLGFVPVRKKDKLPGQTIGINYALEYGQDRIEIHADAVKAGDRVALIDDLIATGGTAIAATQLLTSTGASVPVAAFLVDLPTLGGAERLAAHGPEVRSLLAFDGH